MADDEPEYWDRVRTRWSAAYEEEPEAPSTELVPDLVIKRWINPFAAARIPLAITGMRGAGKSTLLDGFADGILLSRYRPRGESPAEELRRVLAKSKNGKKRFQILVVPGQKDSREGKTALDHVFDMGRYPDGVVHVVSWGYSTIWNSGREKAVLDEIANLETQSDDWRVSLEDIRRYNLNLELQDFVLTCKRLQRAWERSNSPVWLVIAVSKADLYRSQLDKAGNYYLPAKNSEDDRPFARELRKLVNYLGERSLRRLAVVPVSSYPERFTVGAEVIAEGSGDIQFTEDLMRNFRRLIGEFCDAG